MKVLDKEFYPLKSGHTFAILTLRGERGEEVNIAEEGVSGKVIFFSEAPKTDYQCSYCAEENLITLGGAQMETEGSFSWSQDPNKHNQRFRETRQAKTKPALPFYPTQGDASFLSSFSVILSIGFELFIQRGGRNKVTKSDAEKPPQK